MSNTCASNFPLQKLQSTHGPLTCQNAMLAKHEVILLYAGTSATVTLGTIPRPVIERSAQTLFSTVPIPQIISEFSYRNYPSCFDMHISIIELENIWHSISLHLLNLDSGNSSIVFWLMLNHQS